MLTVTTTKSSHLLVILQSLCSYGWKLIQAPTSGKLVRNGQRIVLTAEGATVHFRLFVYKVTGSGRSRPDERRIEITSTYQKGLKSDPSYPDVVLGYSVEYKSYVGVDARRMMHGGRTGNASSFFDREGLDWDHDEILIRPRRANIFSEGFERHAFFKSPRLAEYLYNRKEIHSGIYIGRGKFFGSITLVEHSLEVRSKDAKGDTLVLASPRARREERTIATRRVRAYESGKLSAASLRTLSPEEFLDIKRIMDENGKLGEEFVLRYERQQLRRAGCPDLANQVRWISQRSVMEGYDILSYEPSGTEKWIEVKATSGYGDSFDLSRHEWQTARRARAGYYIYYVTQVRSSRPHIRILRDPFDLERQGQLARTANGWSISITTE